MRRKQYCTRNKSGQIVWGHIYEDASGNRVEITSLSKQHTQQPELTFKYTAYATPKAAQLFLTTHQH